MSASETGPAPVGRELPLLNARRWALGFLAFAVVLAIVFSQFLIGFAAHAH